MATIVQGGEAYLLPEPDDVAVRYRGVRGPHIALLRDLHAGGTEAYVDGQWVKLDEGRVIPIAAFTSDWPDEVHGGR